MAREKNFRLARIITLTVVTVLLLASLAAAQEDAQTHVVTTGETLAGIAAEYEITLDSLLAANDIDDPDLILVGQELVIPAEATPLDEAEASEDDEAADEAETAEDDEVEDKPETADEDTEPSNETPTARALPADGDVYVVQPGDILDLIAQELDISLLAIAYANDMAEPYPLMPGQVLVIPTEPAYGIIPAPPSPSDGLADGQGGGGALDGQIYVIQPGDILDSLAQDYDISLDTLLAVNDISDPAGLMPGEVIVIPNDAPAYGAIPILNPELLPDDGLADGQGGGGPVEEDNDDESSTTEQIYVVQEGDTILSIVNEQKVSLAALLRVNPDLLEQLNLEPGTELVLP